MKMLDSTGASTGLWGYAISGWSPAGLRALITTLWAWQFSQISVYLPVNLSSPSSVCLWECYGTQCQKPCKSQETKSTAVPASTELAIL